MNNSDCLILLLNNKQITIAVIHPKHFTSIFRCRGVKLYTSQLKQLLTVGFNHFNLLQIFEGHFFYRGTDHEKYFVVNKIALYYCITQDTCVNHKRHTQWRVMSVSQMEYICSNIAWFILILTALWTVNLGVVIIRADCVVVISTGSSNEIGYEEY